MKWLNVMLFLDLGSSMKTKIRRQFCLLKEALELTTSRDKHLKDRTCMLSFSLRLPLLGLEDVPLDP